MSFTSSIFLIGLLPWLVVLMYCFRNNGSLRKFLIIVANIVFYIWSGVGMFTFAFLYAFCTWMLTKLVLRLDGKRPLIYEIIRFFVLVPLITVKYMGFAIDIVNGVVGIGFNPLDLVVPIGISFYTFEAFSLLSDVRTKKIPEKFGFLDVYMYLTFFPTVTSGPIIRFQDFKHSLDSKLNASGYGKAIDRIVLGLSKKVLVADKIAVIADYYFDGVAAGNSYSCSGLLVGSLAYTLQLYFDFSGYSDMAIGIGRLLGFEICENFDHPYWANSISDFWRRWHISLSRWFRDYVYIPLGGNRCSKLKHVFNLFVVWLLTGIWHGADWSFVLWGIGYFVLLVIEKYVPFMKNIGKHWYGHVYSLFFVIILWIFFRADNLSVAFRYITMLFDFRSIGIVESEMCTFMPFLTIAISLCLPWGKWFERFEWLEQKKVFGVMKGVASVLLAFMSICAVINSSYTPYIYGKF